MHTKKIMTWKIKYVAVLILLFLVFPSTAFSYEQEMIALRAYIDALSQGNLTKINSLLSHDFEYIYYKDGKINKIARDDELKSLKKLFMDTRNLYTKGFDRPNLLEQNKEKVNNFQVKFSIYFDDSPKVYTDSFFRGAVLDIDERLVVTVEKKQIKTIEETRGNKSTDELSFGLLKYIYASNTEVKDVKIKGGWIFELYDRDCNVLLVIKKVLDVRNEYIKETYYWPNKKMILNFE